MQERAHSLILTGTGRNELTKEQEAEIRANFAAILRCLAQFSGHTLEYTVEEFKRWRNEKHRRLREVG